MKPPSPLNLARVAVGGLLILGGTGMVIDQQATKTRVETSQACNVVAFEALQRALIERSDVVSQERAVDGRLVRVLVEQDESASAAGIRREARVRWLVESEALDRQRLVTPYPAPANCSVQ